MCVNRQFIRGGVAMALLATAALAAPVTTVFTYQGQLKLEGYPVNDTVDLQFTLWDAAVGGIANLTTVNANNVNVVNGLFKADLDFGAAAFSGNARWLQIAVRSPAGAGSFETLTPRQALNAAPYALYALNAPANGGSGGTLDQAYDFGGAGVGRTIMADSGAVAINGPDGMNVAGGILSGPVRVHRNGDDLDLELRRGPTVIGADPDNVSLGGLYITGTPQSPVDHFAYLRVTSSDHRIIRDPAADLRFSTQTTLGNDDVAVNPVDQLTLTSDAKLGLRTTAPELDFQINGTSSLLVPSRTSMGVRTSISTIPPNAPITSWLYLSAGEGNAIIRDQGTGLSFAVEATLGTGTLDEQMKINSNGSLQVKGGSDAGLASGGQLVIGETDAGNLAMDTNEVMARSNGGPATLYLNHENGTVAIGALSPAGVGIGTSLPKQKLHVNGDYYGRGHLYLYAYEGDGSSGTAYVQARDDTNTTNIDLRLRSKAGSTAVDVLTCKSNGRVGIGTTAPASLLDVAGTARVNVLTIDGGADLSENFDVLAASHGAADAEPGTVVIIDAENAGKLKVSARAYDNTVAGIISGAGGVGTGMVMAHEGTLADGRHPVALTGRVYCKVDASYGAIKPGDLLTTSDTPGHAMKVTDRERAGGAILGKAMTSLAAGEKGLVLVLVSLQ